MIKIIKKNNYYFLENNKLLKTLSNNKVKIKEKNSFFLKVNNYLML